MTNLRKYGEPPYKVALIHGGPGAGGEMAPIARALESGRGVLEPIQTADSVDGQMEELRAVLEGNGDVPVTLIGYSWGAWLSMIVTARYPSLVKKLILVGCGGFTEDYAEQTRINRQDRLTDDEKAEFDSLLISLGDRREVKDGILARLGELVADVDIYARDETISHESEILPAKGDIFQSVWKDAEKMRNSGELLKLAGSIQCPVVAIHGDYDTHPGEGVREPLSGILKDFRFILLEKCGHTPWMERFARSKFFEILEEEL